MTYKKILTGYVNDSKDGKGKYLSIKNNSEEPIVIEPGQSIFLNMTPKDIRERNPNVPMFSKSIKIEDESLGDITSEDVPF